MAKRCPYQSTASTRHVLSPGVLSDQYDGQLSEDVLRRGARPPNVFAASATSHELYWNVLLPFPRELAGTVWPRSTLRPVITAPLTVLFPFEVIVPPTRMIPLHVVDPPIVRLFFTTSVPRPSPGNDQSPGWST